MSVEDRYVYRVVWSDEDEEFVGLCAEFPSLSHLAPSRGDALDGIARLVADEVAEMVSNQEAPPQPIADANYSGNLRLRLNPGLHKALSIEAKERGTSLNRLIQTKLLGAR